MQILTTFQINKILKIYFFAEVFNFKLSKIKWAGKYTQFIEETRLNLRTLSV
jgi:hypothetical protein